MTEVQSEPGGGSKAAALHRAAAAATLAAVWTGRILAYPVSLAYRVVANATSSAVPFLLLIAIAWAVSELYDLVVGWMDSETFKLIVAIGLASWILNTFLDRAWHATAAFLGALRKVSFAGLPPWIPGFVLGEELRRSRQRLRSTAQSGFRELLKPTRDFLALVVLAVLLYAAVKAAAASDAKDHIVWVVPPDGYATDECERDGTSCPSGDECFAPIECSLATRGLENGMEFILAYPPVDREPPPDLLDQHDWDDGLGLRGHRRNLLQLIKEASSMCSTPGRSVSLTVEGFASDQPPQDVSQDRREDVNLDFAHERAAVAAAFLCGLDPSAARPTATCTGPTPNADEDIRFNVQLTTWRDHKKMVQNRPHDGSRKRMRFVHRSVRVTVGDPGRCPLNESS